MEDLHTNNNTAVADLMPLEKVNPKKVNRNVNLTLWEKLYIFEVIRGLAITSKHFFINLIGFVLPPKGKKRKIITVYYPEEKAVLPIAYRGRPVLVMKDDKTEKCVACGLCEKICPSFAISIVGAERENKERFPLRYTLDMSRCVFCGFCEEVCPKEAIVMSGEYEGLADIDRKNMLYEKERLLKYEKDVKGRIEYVRRIYGKCNY
jgi:NADH-quinone oxidoreductase subunit I